MEKRNLDLPKLTENDRKVLKKILDSNSIPDSEIAKSMHLSPQAIFKIRGKLEETGIIKGYVPIIDYKKIGITVMTLIIFRLSPSIWKKNSDEKISEKIRSAPYVVEAYRVADENASHILLLAFRDTTQKEKYIAELQTKFADEIHIKGVYTFSVDKIISQNQMNVLNEILNKTEFTPNDIFLNRIK